MQHDIELRRAVEQAGGCGRGKRFPDELKQRMLSYMGARRSAGAKLREIADEVGISWRTVSRWLLHRRVDRVDFNAVHVAAEQRLADIVVRGPHGIRVEGLGLDDLAELIRRLG